MLEKKVCKYCQAENGDQWDSRQEELWNEVGRVLCPQDYLFADVQGRPPCYCPYDLEHTVNQDAE